MTPEGRDLQKLLHLTETQTRTFAGLSNARLEALIVVIVASGADRRAIVAFLDRHEPRGLMLAFKQA